MSKKYKCHNQSGIYFISFSVKDWIDVFTRTIYLDIVVDSLDYSISKGDINLYAWCIMSNHLHLILKARNKTIGDFVRDFKKFTSKKIIRAIKENPSESRKEWLLELFLVKNNRCFWARGYHPIELWSTEIFQQKLDYLHDNPVVSGMVRKPEHYVYSSANDYNGVKGLLVVDIF